MSTRATESVQQVPAGPSTRTQIEARKVARQALSRPGVTHCALLATAGALWGFYSDRST